MQITTGIILNHGLTKDEYKKIIKLIGKEPNMLELGIFSAMWNEHCSYKSSKKYLKTLPTKSNKVIQGPGENAGIVDIEIVTCFSTTVAPKAIAEIAFNEPMVWSDKPTFNRKYFNISRMVIKFDSLTGAG